MDTIARDPGIHLNAGAFSQARNSICSNIVQNSVRAAFFDEMEQESSKQAVLCTLTPKTIFCAAV